MCGQGLLVLGRPTCFVTSTYRQPVQRFPLTRSAEASGRCTTGSQSTNVVHAWWCSVLCEMFSVTLSWPMEDPLHGLHAPRPTPGLSPLDIYLWGHVNTLVYAAPVDKKRHIALWMPVRLSATALHLNGRGRPWWDVSRRALNLMEDILVGTLCKYTHKLNVFGDMLIWTFFSCFGMWNSSSIFARTFQLHPVYTYNVYVCMYVLFSFRKAVSDLDPPLKRVVRVQTETRCRGALLHLGLGGAEPCGDPKACFAPSVPELVI
jgi:hypothetical protein